MGQLWRRDIPLAERLGNGSPVGFAPGPPATAAPQQHNTSWVPEAPVVTPEEPIFLMTATAQTISGFFVWTALLITCHQVRRGGGGGGVWRSSRHQSVCSETLRCRCCRLVEMLPGFSFDLQVTRFVEYKYLLL